MFTGRVLLASIGLGVAALGSAQTSFDLMMLPDNNTNRVIRFDPNSRVALGEFGDFGPLPGTRYVTVGSNGRAYVTSPLGTTIVNYNTGLNLGFATSLSSRVSISPNGGRLFSTVANNVAVLSPNLVTEGSFSGPIVFNTVTATSDNRAVLFGWNANQIRVTPFNAATGFGPLATAGNIVVNGTIGSSQASVSGSAATIGVTFMDSLFGRSYTQVNQDLTTGSVNTVTSTLSGGSVFAANAHVMVMPAHGGWWLVGDDATNADLTRIAYYGPDFNFAYSYTTNAVNVPQSDWGGHNIVAPEPGTMVALGLGLAALLKRRRRSSAS